MSAPTQTMRQTLAGAKADLDAIEKDAKWGNERISR
jgi:hypothetical protein